MIITHKSPVDPAISPQSTKAFGEQNTLLSEEATSLKSRSMCPDGTVVPKYNLIPHSRISIIILTPITSVLEKIGVDS